VHGPGTKLYFIGLQSMLIEILTGLSTFSVVGLSNFFQDIAYFATNIIWHNINIFMILC